MSRKRTRVSNEHSVILNTMASRDLLQNLKTHRKDFVHFDGSGAQLLHLPQLVQQLQVDLHVLQVLDGGPVVDHLKKGSNVLKINMAEWYGGYSGWRNCFMAKRYWVQILLHQFFGKNHATDIFQFKCTQINN